MKMSDFLSVSRRRFLNSMGCLTIGFPLLNGSLFSDNQVADELFPRSLREQPKINAWLEILEDGRVRVLTGKMELGQGIRTAIAQVAAEELEMELIWFLFI
jgi:hypothetical protein